MIEEPHGRIEIEGTVTFPAEEIPEVAEEVLPKPFPWGWVMATGSLIFSLIICLATKSEKQ